VRLARALGARHAFRRWRNDRRYADQRPARIAGATRAIWTEAAAVVGAELDEVSPNVFEFRMNGVTTRVLGQRTSLSTPECIERASDKPAAYRLLREAGLPTPEHIVVGAHDIEEAARFLEQAASPCVVKPARGSGGEGVVGGVGTVAQLRRAIRRVVAISSDVLIERQVLGDHYRLLVLDGEVVDAVRRVKPQVIGDGRATIEELIFREYERRLEAAGDLGLKPFVADLDCLFALEQQGVDLRCVLPEGAVATVMNATNFGGPTDSETFRGDISPELEDEARRACEVLGTRLGGVDVIASRTDISLSTSGGAILEVNPIPGLTHHYAVAEPVAAIRVAVPILRLLLADAAKRQEQSSEAL
jgi:cyanophycin synthetase